MSTRTPVGSVALALLLFIVGLSPKHATAQNVDEASAMVADAEASYARGNPDYIKIRRAIAAADASGDLRLRSRAYMTLARADSSANRRTKAFPNFRLARDLAAQADAADLAVQVDEAQAAAESAAATEAAAIAERDRVAQELEAAKSASNTKLYTAIAIAAAILALLGFIFFATVTKLRGDIAKARAAQDLAEADSAEARSQMSTVATRSMKRLRNLLRTFTERIPAQAPGSGANQLAAHEAGIQAMVQSGFDSGSSFEVAAESFFEKYTDRLVALSGTGNARLKVDSMPLRLPLDQAIPFTMFFTEVVNYAFAAGSQSLRATLTKEGNSATLNVVDESNAVGAFDEAAKELKYARLLASDMNGKLSTIEGPQSGIQLRFTTVSGRVAQPGVTG